MWPRTSMVHSVWCHDFVLDSLFEQEHAFIECLNLESEQILDLIGFVIDPLQFQMWDFDVLCFEKTRIQKIINPLLVNLEEGTTDRVLDVFILSIQFWSFIKERFHTPRSDAKVSSGFHIRNWSPVIASYIVIAFHGIGLTRWGLAIS